MRILNCDVDEHHTRPWEARSHMYSSLCRSREARSHTHSTVFLQASCPHRKTESQRQKTSCVSLPESSHSDRLPKAVERVESLGLLYYCGGYLLHVALNLWKVANSTEDLSVKSHFLFIHLNEL